MYGRKAWAVVAYTYDADIHCVDCTLNRFPQLRSIVNDYATDSEGNDVNVVFSSDYEGGDHCGTCHESID